MLSIIYFNYSLNVNVRYDIIDMDDFLIDVYLFNFEFNKFV